MGLVSRLRLLQVNKAYFPHVGGVERIVTQIAEGLVRRGRLEVEVLVCTERGKGSVERINGVTVHRSSTLRWVMSMPISLDFLLAFSKRVRGCDVILFHHPFPLGFLADQISRCKKPMAVWYHSDIVRQRIANRLLKPLWARAFKRAQRIFVSDLTLAENSSVLTPYRSKCISAPFGIEVDKYQETSEVRRAADAIRRRYGTPLVLAVGRLVYYKGFEYLIESIKWVNAQLLIVGSGPLKGRLLELAQSIGVADRVHIVDTVFELIPYYHACDLFVLPSVERSETFGLVQLEAMACGRPVINTALPTAVPRVSVHMETGLTVPPRDSKALSEAINRLLQDDELRTRLGMQARARAAEKFNLDRFLDVVESELCSLC